MKRYMILSITLQRTHCQVPPPPPPAAPARNNKVQTQRPEQVLGCGGAGGRGAVVRGRRRCLEQLVPAAPQLGGEEGIGVV